MNKSDQKRLESIYEQPELFALLHYITGVYPFELQPYEKGKGQEADRLMLEYLRVSGACEHLPDEAAFAIVGDLAAFAFDVFPNDEDRGRFRQHLVEFANDVLDDLLDRKFAAQRAGELSK